MVINAMLATITHAIKDNGLFPYLPSIYSHQPFLQKVHGDHGILLKNRSRSMKQ